MKTEKHVPQSLEEAEAGAPVSFTLFIKTHRLTPGMITAAQIQRPKSVEPWWRTFILWLPCFLLGWNVCYLLGMKVLEHYHQRDIIWISSIPFWQGFLLFGTAKAGGDIVWYLFKKWRRGR